MLAGFSSPVPYFFSIYFGILRMNRAFRDDHDFAIKYVADWNAYTAKVPNLFVPGLFQGLGL